MDNPNISEEERKYREYKVQVVFLKEEVVEELLAKLRRKFESEGKPFPKTKLLKSEIIDLLLPPVPRPATLSFMSQEIIIDDPLAPPEIRESELLLPNGKVVNKKVLEDLCRQRNIPYSNKNKDHLKELLLAYKRSEFRKKSKKWTRLDAFKIRPPTGSILGRLWDLIEEGIQDLMQRSELVAASELLTLRPHILRHMDNSFNYHIIKHSNIPLFVIFYCNGVEHWQGRHGMCTNCKQEGVVSERAAIGVVEWILSTSSMWIKKEEPESIWKQ